MRTQRLAWLVGLAVLVGSAGVASAQVPLGGVNLEGEIEAGGRFYVERPYSKSRAKFEEYRDLAPGLFLEGLRLRVFRPDEGYSAEFGGAQWGYDDQEYYLSAGSPGRWRFDFVWDQTPHIISTTGSLLATETSRGVFTLPLARPRLPVHNTAPGLDEIGVRWDKAAMKFNFSLSPEFDVTAEYTRTRKEGDKPMGMSFGSPGNNFYEVLQPIEQTVHDFRLRGAYGAERYQVQFAYGLSVFENDLTRIRADNPCFGNIAPCSASDAAGPITGQSSLPPSNMAHSLNLAGGANLPMRTRLNFNAAWGLHLQTDSFLPHTINGAFLGNRDLVLPAHNLDGFVQTWLVNVSATTRPFDRVTFGAKYRFYSYDDHSRQLTFPAVVLNDRVLEPVRTAGRWSWQTQSAELDARTQLLQNVVAMTTGVGWQHWVRNSHREVPESDEFSAKLTIDATPTDWLLTRASYTPSFRRINRYNTRAHAEHSVEDDPAAAFQGQSILLRKFDEANFDRQKVTGLLQFTLADSLTVSPTVSWTYTDYIASTLGVQQQTSWSAGIDVGWRPAERFSLSAGYTYEEIFEKMRSRSRPVTGVTTFDFLDYDWISDMTDTVQTAYLSTKTNLVEKVLDLLVNANYSNAIGKVHTRNPIGLVSGNAAQRNSARAMQYPDFEDTLFRLETSLKYHFMKSWSAKVGYVFEFFEKSDWRTDQLSPFIPGISSIWLGNDLRHYTAQYLGITLAYTFK